MRTYLSRVCVHCLTVFSDRMCRVGNNRRYCLAYCAHEAYLEQRRRCAARTRTRKVTRNGC